MGNWSSPDQPDDATTATYLAAMARIDELIQTKRDGAGVVDGIAGFFTGTNPVDDQVAPIEDQQHHAYQQWLDACAADDASARGAAAVEAQNVFNRANDLPLITYTAEVERQASELAQPVIDGAKNLAPSLAFGAGAVLGLAVLALAVYLLVRR